MQRAARFVLMAQESLAVGARGARTLFNFGHKWCGVDTVDYFASPEEQAQLHKTADEEFLPWDEELKRKKK